MKNNQKDNNNKLESTIEILQVKCNNNEFEEMKLLVENDTELIKKWNEQATNNIFSKLETDQLIELFTRFDLSDKIELSVFLANFRLKLMHDNFDSSPIVPRYFLIAASKYINLTIDDMMKLDCINLNPFIENSELLYLDIDGVGMNLKNCTYNIFNGDIEDLSEKEAYKFERLLMSSISLKKPEKLAIIRNMNSINRFQKVELLKIWDEEIDKFSKLKLQTMKGLKKQSNKHKIHWEEIEEEIKKEKVISSRIDKNIFDSTNSFTPKAIMTYLNESIIGQEESTKKISTAIYYQLKLLEKDNIDNRFPNDSIFNNKINKSSTRIGPILLAGETGSGKTMIVKKAASFSKVNFLHIDASSLVEDGVVGKSTDCIAKDLLRQTDFDTEKAEKSIIFFDECDKLLQKDSGQAILFQLLRFTEGADMPINISNSDHDANKLQDIKFLSTKQMLIVFSGAFQNIIDKTTVGFGSKREVNNKKLSKDDILKSGLPKELLGRIKQTIVLNSLSEDDYYKILTKSKDSPIKDYIKKIEINDNMISFDDEILHKIANIASKSTLGVRAIAQILEELFDDILFESPQYQYKEFTLTVKDLELLMEV